MSAYLYTWNPNKWDWKDFQYAVYCMNNDEPYDRRWSCGNTKRIVIGDLFFLMRLGVEPKGIIGCGYVLSIPKLDFIHSCSIAHDIDKAFDDCRCWFLPVWGWN